MEHWTTSHSSLLTPHFKWAALSVRPFPSRAVRASPSRSRPSCRALRGVKIKRGDKVVTWYASANRDEAMFPEPYTFDVTRTPNDHVTFGPGGPHFCLGAHLARLETKILFQELLPRLKSIELVGPVERIRSDFVNGLQRMPVRIVAA